MVLSIRMVLFVAKICGMCFIFFYSPIAFKGWVLCFFFLVCVSMASIFVWDDAWDLMLRFVVIPGASRQGHWATTLQEFEINLEDNDCTATNIAEMMVNSGNYPHM